MESQGNAMLPWLEVTLSGFSPRSPAFPHRFGQPFPSFFRHASASLLTGRGLAHLNGRDRLDRRSAFRGSLSGAHALQCCNCLIESFSLISQLCDDLLNVHTNSFCDKLSCQFTNLPSEKHPRRYFDGGLKERITASNLNDREASRGGWPLDESFLTSFY